MRMAQSVSAYYDLISGVSPIVSSANKFALTSELDVIRHDGIKRQCCGCLRFALALAAQVQRAIADTHRLGGLVRGTDQWVNVKARTGYADIAVPARPERQ